MRILLAIDGSECSLDAVAEICRRPWPTGTEVRLITVDSPMLNDPLGGGRQTVFDEINQQMRVDALKHLNEAAAIIRRDAPDLLVDPVLREGSPKDVILDEAERWPAELIVVGSHGHGAIRRFFLGSVSLAVATNASCSVEIVRAPARSLDDDSTSV